MSTKSVELPTLSAMSITWEIVKGFIAAMAIHIIYGIYQAREEIADAYREALRAARASQSRDDPPRTSRPTLTSSRKRSPYNVLGVERGASQAEIKKNYQRLVLECHPDKHSEALQSALEQMIQINSAYEVLGCRAMPNWKTPTVAPMPTWRTPTVAPRPTWKTPTVASMPSQTVPIGQPGPQPTSSMMYYAHELTTHLESPVVLGALALPLFLVIRWSGLRLGRRVGENVYTSRAGRSYRRI